MAKHKRKPAPSEEPDNHPEARFPGFDQEGKLAQIAYAMFLKKHPQANQPQIELAVSQAASVAKALFESSRKNLQNAQLNRLADMMGVTLSPMLDSLDPHHLA